MKKLMFALVGASFAASALAVGESVYRNPDDDTGATLGGHASNFYLPSAIDIGTGDATEYADDITLAGTNRNITELSVQYIADLAVVAGDEGVRVRLYALDGALLGTPPAASPGTLLWDSGPILVQPDWNGIRIPVPNVTVPTTMAWSISSTGVAGVAGDQIGVFMFGPPTTGTSDHKVWAKGIATDPWDYEIDDYTDSTSPYGSMAMTMWANGGPVIPYDDTTSTTCRLFISTIGASPQERGDDVIFEGANRTMDRMEVEYVTDVTTPTGTEGIIVKIYPRKTGYIEPIPDATPLFTSPTILINAVGTAIKKVTVPLGGLTLPDSCIWTVQVTGGMTQVAGNRYRGLLRTAPSSGNSTLAIYINDGTSNPPFGWGTYWHGNPTANYTNAISPAVLWPTAGGTPSANNPVGNYGAKFIPQVKIRADSVVKIRGTTLSGGPADVNGSDDVRWELRPGIVFANTQNPAEIECTGTALGATPTALSATIEDQTSAGAVRRKSSAFDYVANAYVLLTSPTDPAWGALNTDELKTYSLTPATNIKAGTFEMKMNYGYRAVAAVFAFPWKVRIDDFFWTYTP